MKHKILSAPAEKGFTWFLIRMQLFTVMFAWLTFMLFSGLRPLFVLWASISVSLFFLPVWIYLYWKLGQFRIRDLVREFPVLSLLIFGTYIFQGFFGELKPGDALFVVIIGGGFTELGLWYIRRRS